MAIQKAAVIGAGLMGGGIAAHIANAGHDVVLLDIVPDGAKDRNALADGSVARMLKTDPAPFMEKSDAKRIATGNIEDHLHLLADADWIVEAVIEKTDAKQAIYAKIDSVRKPGSIVSSNTSTIPSSMLLDGMPEAFRRDFLITHFFNPAALHASAGGGGGARDPGRRRGRRLRLRRPQARQGRGALQRHAGLHRQPHRHLLADRRRARGRRERRDGGGGGRGAGPPHRRAQDRRFRADRPGRPRPHAAGGPQPARRAAGERPLPRGLRRARVRQRDDREWLHRPQGQGRLLPAEAGLRDEREGGARPRHRRVRPRPAPAAGERRAGRAARSRRCSSIRTRPANTPGK